MARKRKVLPPPHLCCVTILPSKTNTTANIGVKCLHFSRNVMFSVEVSPIGKTRVVFIDPGAKVNSSYYCNIVLEKGLLPDIRAICRQLQVDTVAGRSASAQRPDHDGLLSNKEHINFSEPHMWPPNSPDINPVDYAIWGAHQQRVYHQRQLKTVEELK